MKKFFIQHNFLIKSTNLFFFCARKIELGYIRRLPSKLRTIPIEDWGWYPSPSLVDIRVEPLQSNKPIKNVEKQGKFKKWFGKIFPSSSSFKPNKNKKLTTKDIGQAKDLRRIPSTTTTNADHIDDKPIELSEWNPQTPSEKIRQVRHVGDPSDYGIPKVNGRSGLQPEELQEEQLLILQQQIQEQLQIQKATIRKRSLLLEKQMKLMNKDDRKNSYKNLNRFISQQSSSSSASQAKSNPPSTTGQNPIKTNIFTKKTKNLTELANLILRIPNNNTNTKYL